MINMNVAAMIMIIMIITVMMVIMVNMDMIAQAAALSRLVEGLRLELTNEADRGDGSCGAWRRHELSTDSCVHAPWHHTRTERDGMGWEEMGRAMGPSLRRTMGPSIARRADTCNNPKGSQPTRKGGLKRARSV